VSHPKNAGRRMRPNAARLSNTDAMRRMIRWWVGMAEPMSLPRTRAPM
jgi:hypothetical protein